MLLLRLPLLLFFVLPLLPEEDELLDRMGTSAPSLPMNDGETPEVRALNPEAALPLERRGAGEGWCAPTLEREAGACTGSSSSRWDAAKLRGAGRLATAADVAAAVAALRAEMAFSRSRCCCLREEEEEEGVARAELFIEPEPEPAPA